MITMCQTSSLIAAVLCVSSSAFAQSTSAPVAQSASVESAIKDESTKNGPPSLAIYFQSGSSSLRPDDKASRAYNEGKPIVMILTGSSDRAGTAAANLTLSRKRATAVLNGLLGRGIPADRFQVVAKGETDLAVSTSQGVSGAENRSVEITWR